MTSLSKIIKNFKNSDRILFTTPSHDRGNFINPLFKEIIPYEYLKNDLSEIDGLDNLLNPTGVILKSMKKSAKKYKANNVFYLQNGSSSGILGVMLALLKENDEVIIARNCHKSVINGLTLTGAFPKWIYPEYLSEWGIFGKISPIDIDKNISDKTKLVIITSPTYEGISSDICEIKKICDKYNCPLLVDSAHGGLKTFLEKPFSNGNKPDFIVQSLHKTCGAINSSAILISNNPKYNEIIQKSLNLITTTSPSYPVLAGIELTIDYLFSKEGQKEIRKLQKNIKTFKKNLSKLKNISILDNDDIFKIYIKFDNLSGFEISKILDKKYNIEDENATKQGILFYTGIGTDAKKLKILENSIIQISKLIKNKEKKKSQIYEKYQITTKQKLNLKDCFYFNKKEEIDINNACGQISAETITPYPPGIPILIAGEIIKQKHIEILKKEHKTLKIIFNP